MRCHPLITLVLLIFIHRSACQKEEIINFKAIQEHADLPFLIAEKNSPQLLQLIENAKADLLIFPEYSLTGTNPRALVPLAMGDYAFRIENQTNLCQTNFTTKTKPNDKVLAEVACKAKTAQKALLLSILEEIHENNLYYSTVLLVDKEGKIAFKYRKTVIEELHVGAYRDKQEDSFQFSGKTYRILMGYEFLEKGLPDSPDTIYYAPMVSTGPYLFQINNRLVVNSTSNSYRPSEIEFPKWNFTSTNVYNNKIATNDLCQLTVETSNPDILKRYKLMGFNNNAQVFMGIPLDIKLCFFIQTPFDNGLNEDVAAKFESIQLMPLDGFKSKWSIMTVVGDNHTWRSILQPINTLEKLQNVEQFLMYALILEHSNGTSTNGFVIALIVIVIIAIMAGAAFYLRKKGYFSRLF